MRRVAAFDFERAAQVRDDIAALLAEGAEAAGHRPGPQPSLPFHGAPLCNLRELRGANLPLHTCPNLPSSRPGWQSVWNSRE